MRHQWALVLVSLLLVVLALVFAPARSATRDLPVQTDPRELALETALHDAALCACGDPLRRFIATVIEPRTAGKPATRWQYAGEVHSTLLLIDNARFGGRNHLIEGHHHPDAALYAAIDNYITAVQDAHGIPEGGPSLVLPPRIDKGTSSSMEWTTPTNVRMQCPACANALCDARRLSHHAAEARNRGTYHDGCADGGCHPDDNWYYQYNTRIWRILLPVPGFWFKSWPQAESNPEHQQWEQLRFNPLTTSITVTLGYLGVPILSHMPAWEHYVRLPRGPNAGDDVVFEYQVDSPTEYPWLPVMGLAYQPCHDLYPTGSGSGDPGAGGQRPCGYHSRLAL